MRRGTIDEFKELWVESFESVSLVLGKVGTVNLSLEPMNSLVHLRRFALKRVLEALLYLKPFRSKSSQIVMV